jgi:hypothetical protein
MKRLSVGASVALVLGGGIGSCAQPEELDEAVVRGAEDYYFSLPANPPPAPPGTVAPQASTTGAPPPIPPANTAPLAPAIPDNEQAASDDVAPPQSIPLETWLQGE